MSTDDVSRRTFMRTAGGAAAAAGAATATAGTAAAQEEEPDWPSEADNGNLGTYEDARGQDEVTVMVGADDGLAFDATKLWVDPGTTITWEWTGAGGAHNVVNVEGPADLDSGDAVDTEGHTYEYEVTEEDAGITSYVCAPHEGVNMFGGVAVGDDIDTVDVGGGGEGSAVFVPQGARALGIATFIAMVSTLGLAFVFMKYGGTITQQE